MDKLMQAIPFSQTLWFQIILLVIGFVFLIKGADFFVEGSSSVAKRLKVPSIIIGMTIVAMGTSLPETAVSITASITDNNALAISNAVGSNIFNLMVVIGACALLVPVKVQLQTLKKDIPFSILCALALLALGAIGMTLGHIDGVILLVIFVGFILSMINNAKKARNAGEEENEFLQEAENMELLSVGKSVLYIVLGACAIGLGGDFVVDSASFVAAHFGISQTIIGLTVVALGTSLPELVTSIVAARKDEVDMALGNAIGSNVFNILMVLGIAGAISPITFMMENIIDIVILVAFSAIVWVMAWTKKRLDKGEGLIMILLYAAYVVYICMR